jgi:hypothetical protein
MALFLERTEHRRLNLKMDGVELLYDLAPVAKATTMTLNVYQHELQLYLEKIHPSFFSVEMTSVKASHGLKLTPKNCPDIHRLDSMVAGDKVRENCRAAIRKIVRIVATIYPHLQESLILLAKPGYLWKLLVMGKHTQMSLRHFATTNRPSTVTNYCLFVRQFVKNYWSQYRPDCLSAFAMTLEDNRNQRDLIRDKVSSKMERVCAYLRKVGNDAKKKNRHSQVQRQEINAKEKSGRMPNLENYRRVLEYAATFFKKSYRHLQDVLDAKQPLYYEEEHGGHLCEELQFVMWSTRVHFMYFSDCQRRNQYDNILVEEFYLYLMELQVDKNDRPISIDRGHVCLDLKDPYQNTMLVDMTRKAVRSHGRLFLEIRRYPLHMDKRHRDKERAWTRWVLEDNHMVCKVVWYCTTILPLIKKTLSQHGRKFNPQAMFHHTESLHPLLSASFLLRDKVSYYDYHAEKQGFREIKHDDGSSGATYWRHAFATSEMLKYEAKEDYHWCTDLNEVAYEISLRMNNSAKEVLDTYSSLFYRRDTANISKTKPTSVFVLPEDADSDNDESKRSGASTKNQRPRCHSPTTPTDHLYEPDSGYHRRRPTHDNDESTTGHV